MLVVAVVVVLGLARFDHTEGGGTAAGPRRPGAAAVAAWE